MAKTTDDPLGNLDSEAGRAAFAVDEAHLSTAQALKASLIPTKGGDLGVTPALLGLIALTVFFGIFADRFLSTGNFANLITQATWVILLGVAVTFVLLLGEIDLAAGYTAGLSVVTMAWMMAPPHGITPWVAIPTGFLVGATVGAVIGFLVARIGIPAFVVTLAFFLGIQGIVLQIAREGGTISVRNELIIGIVNRNMEPIVGWILWAAVIVGYLALALQRTTSRRKAGLNAEPLGSIVVKAIIIGAGWGIATYLLNQNRAFAGAVRELQGVPWAVLVIIVTVVGLHLLISRTGWGRAVYAIGGNIEAARRAGINVRWVKMSCFIMTGLVACLAGMALASQLNSVSPQTGGNDTLLRAVGAAAIGGVSLFGGRGKLIYPVVGGLVVATIDNGLGLMGTVAGIDFTQSGPKFIVQGLVLLLAASVDAISRQRRAST
jgi:D-xylose transport system permease protein